MGAQQIRQVLPRLGPLPAAALFAFDGGYDPVQLTVELAGTGAQIVVRVRNDRKYFARAAPRAPGQKGASRRHGARLSSADPQTWPEPDLRLELTTAPTAGSRSLPGSGCTRISARTASRVGRCASSRAP